MSPLVHWNAKADGFRRTDRSVPQEVRTNSENLYQVDWLVLAFGRRRAAVRRSADRLADPKVIARQDEFQKLSKECSDLREIVDTYRKYKKVVAEIEQAQELAKGADKEMAEMAHQELGTLNEKKESLEKELQLLLLPKDPNDEKSVFLEVRAGTGGEEAALFAADLLRLYLGYAERNGWRVEIMSKNETGLGGIKEVIVFIEAKGAFRHLKYEGGVHRVQRVPVTEGSGRIHTSAVTVAILPEAAEVEVKIDEKDLRIDVMRASGPGGQSVNTTDSAVRITHIPTGLNLLLPG